MTEWGYALKVGGMGFALVFVILAILYLVLSFTGRLSVRLNSAKTMSADKRVAETPPDKTSASS